MAIRQYAGYEVDITSDGYLTDPSVWSREIAIEIAGEENISLTDEHFLVLEILRDMYFSRVQISLVKLKKSGKINIRKFYGLFPGAALKKAARIAGIPKPENCI